MCWVFSALFSAHSPTRADPLRRTARLVGAVRGGPSPRAEPSKASSGRALALRVSSVSEQASSGSHQWSNISEHLKTDYDYSNGCVLTDSGAELGHEGVRQRDRRRLRCPQHICRWVHLRESALHSVLSVLPECRAIDLSLHHSIAGISGGIELHNGAHCQCEPWQSWPSDCLQNTCWMS